MRKVILLLLLLLSVAMSSTAQTFSELYSDNPYFYHELYSPYPSDRVSDVHPAPKGYVPVYISHIGRHGSRWHISAKWYDGIVEMLSTAEVKGELTEVGTKFLASWREISDLARDRYGELSPRGREEHRGIAERMCRSYPEVFARHDGTAPRIVCRSTVVPRCIFSMLSFVDEVRRSNPWVEAEVDATSANRYLTAYTGLNKAFGQSHVVAEQARVALMPSSDEFMERMFVRGSSVAKSIEDPARFMYDLYIAASNPVFVDGRKMDLVPLVFTEDEIARIWIACNARRYYLEGPSARFGKPIVASVYPLVSDIVQCADAALAGNGVAGDFRFAHDVTMVACTKFMGIRLAQTETDDFHAIARSWRITSISPMASNIQLVFFRNGRGNVLVKVLFCEREQKLIPEAGKPIDGYYYRWSDLRRFFGERNDYFNGTAK